MLEERRIPLWVKLAYTIYVGVVVPVYWQAYGPVNFVYLCDIALLMGLPAVWLERSIWASAPLVGILVPQLIWQIDFLAALAGFELTGLTAYMFRFDDSWELFVRLLSLFHFWLPIFLLWVVWRLGYDRRALLWWTIIGCGALLLSYLFLPSPPPDYPDENVNINFIFGLDNQSPQDWMHPHLWVLAMMLAMFFIAMLPAHWFLRRYFPTAGN